MSNKRFQIVIYVSDCLGSQTVLKSHYCCRSCRCLAVLAFCRSMFCSLALCAFKLNLFALKRLLNTNVS